MTTGELGRDGQCLSNGMGASAESDYGKDYGKDNERMRLHRLYRCLYRCQFSANVFGSIETTGKAASLNH